MLQQIILQEIQLLPEFAQREVLHFLLFTKSKYLGQHAIPQEPAKRPTFGCGGVKVTLSKDFDAPLDDFKDYM
jgi:hypothetical protein